MPGLLLFVALGMLAGSEGIGGVEFDDAELTRTPGTIALVFFLFEGGLAAGWREIRPVIGTALSLAVIGTIATAVLAGLAAALILDLGMLESMIIGAAIATTDSAAIFAVLRGSRLRRRIARTLEGESGINDPIAILLVIGCIEALEDPSFGLLDADARLRSDNPHRARVLVKPCLEQTPATVQSRYHGANRTPHDIGNFFVTQLLDVR